MSFCLFFYLFSVFCFYFYLGNLVYFLLFLLLLSFFFSFSTFIFFDLITNYFAPSIFFSLCLPGTLHLFFVHSFSLFFLLFLFLFLSLTSLFAFPPCLHSLLSFPHLSSSTISLSCCFSSPGSLASLLRVHCFTSLLHCFESTRNTWNFRSRFD